MTARSAETKKAQKIDIKVNKRSDFRGSKGKTTFGMSTKTFDQNPALTSQGLMSLALMSEAPMKKAWRWIMEGGIIHKNAWETTIGGCNWKMKIPFSGQFGRIMQMGIYEE